MSDFTENIHSIQMGVSDLDLNVILARFDNDPTFKSELQSADVLLIPTDLSHEYDGIVFPDSTQAVFHLLVTELADQAVVDAAVKDEEYEESAYLSEDIILPTLFIAKTVLLPLVVSILGRFVYDWLSRDGSRKVEGTVKSELHFKKDKDGTQLSHKYEGPADKFEQVTLQDLRDLLSNQEGNTHVSKEDDTPTSD